MGVCNIDVVRCDRSELWAPSAWVHANRGILVQSNILNPPKILIHKVQVTNAAIALDDVGKGMPVLLLHGFPATRHLWSRVVPLLAQSGYRLLVPDLVGYGASEAAGALSIDMASQARWMLEMIDALSIPQVAVVAHDVGSAAAQIMVASAPRRIRKLVVLDGVHGAEWAMEAIAGIQAWDPKDAHRLFPVLARRLGRSGALREMLAAYEGEQGGLRLIRAARDLDPRQTQYIGEALRSSGVPALVLWGERDEFLSIDAVGRPLAALLGARLAKLPGAHFTPLDCPAEVSAELHGFLGKTEGAAGGDS
jgi:pimeloyl-ACP methyl ester carboxylesterase